VDRARLSGLQDAVDGALRLHEAGRLGEAIAAYERLLPQAEGHAQLLHLLGTAYVQVRRPEQGMALLERSLLLDPANPPACNSLGIAWRSLGRLDEAIASYDRALALDTGYGEAWCNRGLALSAQGRLDEALASFDRALARMPGHAKGHLHRGYALKGLGRLDDALASYDRALAARPDFAEAHNARGVVLAALGRFDDALASYDRALALQRGAAIAWSNRGIALRALGRVDDALASYDQALALEPGQPEALCNRGVALHALRRFDEALACFDQALARRPGFVQAHCNRGNALKSLQRFGDAVAAYDSALALDPALAEAHSNRGLALQEMHRFPEAMASFDRALALKPASAEAHWNKALLLLTQGLYEEGWPLYEWRLRKDDVRRNHPVFPGKLAWRGQEDIRGRRLFVYPEQGLGDVVQFCRYLLLLAASGAELVVEVPPALAGLVGTLACAMTVVSRPPPPDAFDAWCPLLSLPSVFRTRVETIPARVPYLHADPAKVAAWRSRLGAPRGHRVGLVGSGAITHRNDANRSIGLHRLARLLAVPGIEWHSLQKEYREADAAHLAKDSSIRSHHQHLGDFADLAALVECMDLVISVDTSAAHVAGALGKPVWILLPHAPDFRWMLAREDSPWYPTARLYRQAGPGDWEGVLAQAACDLADLPPIADTR
jgi:tetratricopeptide (TPR) repeat protein